MGIYMGFLKTKIGQTAYFKRFDRFDCLGDPLGARTQDPNIKSVVLYRLS